jgi:lysophospholipase L1-like esterase
MTIRSCLLLTILTLCPSLAQAQLVDEFKPPRGNCCLANTAQTLASQLQDWNQLGRYHDANQQLMQQPVAAGRVVFMGDSITDGWRLDQSFPNKPYVNRGIGGQTTAQMLVRMFPDVINLKPSVMVVLAGTNDIARNTGPTTLQMIQDNIQAMSELARAHGIRVVLCSVLPVSDYGRTPQIPQRPPADILRLNEWMKSYAGQSGAVYADYFSATVDAKGFLKEGISADGLHPNAAGYSLMVPIVDAAVQQALSR